MQGTGVMPHVMPHVRHHVMPHVMHHVMHCVMPHVMHHVMPQAALEHMTRYLACEWGPDGIRVNAVALHLNTCSPVHPAHPSLQPYPPVCSPMHPGRLQPSAPNGPRWRRGSSTRRSRPRCSRANPSTTRCDGRRRWAEWANRTRSQPATCNHVCLPCISHASPMHLQVACTVAFLGMEAAGYITGQVVAPQY